MYVVYVEQSSLILFPTWSVPFSGTNTTFNYR